MILYIGLRKIYYQLILSVSFQFFNVPINILKLYATAKLGWFHFKFFSFIMV